MFNTDLKCIYKTFIIGRHLAVKQQHKIRKQVEDDTAIHFR